jgi:hypothetical protein
VAVFTVVEAADEVLEMTTEVFAEAVVCDAEGEEMAEEEVVVVLAMDVLGAGTTVEEEAVMREEDKVEAGPTKVDEIVLVVAEDETWLAADAAAEEVDAYPPAEDVTAAEPKPLPLPVE